MTEDEFKRYLEAGRIARTVKGHVLGLVRPGASVLEVAERIESLIRSMGGEPAFPVNISIGSVAAHYTPVVGDKGLFPERGLAKIDFGVHVDGYIVDTAITIDLGGGFERILSAAREALERAIKRVAPGVSFRDIGVVVDETARRYSLKPIRNLSGHRIDRYKIHAGESIPNYPEKLVPWKFKEGGVYAIEPFITDGAGLVSEERLATIYSVKRSKMKGSGLDERILREAISRFKGLPFCARWLSDLGADVATALERLAGQGVLNRYPVLTEITGGQVAQFEDTVVIYQGTVYVLTSSPP